MRAVVYDQYGPLVKIHATTVTRSDCGWRGAKPFVVRYFTGLRRSKRKILGMEFAGEVEAVGASVSEFGVRDEVFEQKTGNVVLTVNGGSR